MRLAKAGLSKRRERVGRVQLAVFLIGSYAFIADCACPEQRYVQEHGSQAYQQLLRRLFDELFPPD